MEEFSQAKNSPSPCEASRQSKKHQMLKVEILRPPHVFNLLLCGWFLIITMMKAIHAFFLTLTLAAGPVLTLTAESRSAVNVDLAARQ